MKEKQYDRQKVVEYAKKWAYLRNPAYYNFDPVGGDCTNFASQCIFAGAGVMNYNKNGWYYRSGNDKSASWSGVEYLYKFLINNKGVGPYAEETDLKNIKIGDIAQLSFDGNKFAHTLLIVNKIEPVTQSNTFVATHTFDSYGRSITSYNFKKIRYLHIIGINFHMVVKEAIPKSNG